MATLVQAQPLPISLTVAGMTLTALALRATTRFVTWSVLGPWIGDMPTVFIGVNWLMWAVRSFGFVFICMGATKVFLDVASGTPASALDLFRQARHWIPGIIAQAIAGVVCTVGFALMIVPGVIFALALQLYPYIIIDEQQGPVDALAGSTSLTEGHKMRMLPLAGLLIAAIVVSNVVLGALTPLVLTPAVLLGQAVIYTSLRDRLKDGAATSG